MSKFERSKIIEDNHTEIDTRIGTNIDTKIGIKIEGKQGLAGQYGEAGFFKM